MAELPLTLLWTQGWDVDVRRFHSDLWTQNCWTRNTTIDLASQGINAQVKFFAIFAILSLSWQLFINSKIAPWGCFRVQLLDQAFKFNSLTMEFQAQFLWFLWCTVSGIEMLYAFGPWSCGVALLLCSVLGGESKQAQLNLQCPFFARSDKYISIKDTAPDGTAQAMWLQEGCSEFRIWRASLHGAFLFWMCCDRWLWWTCTTTTQWTSVPWKRRTSRAEGLGPSSNPGPNSWLPAK